MRSRCDDENLSLYAYGFLEGDECASFEEHLRTCPRCRAAAEKQLRERDVVAFELGVDAHAFDPEPMAETLVASPRPRRRLLLVAMAASLLLTAAVATWFTIRPDAPVESGWRALPDGSRYRVVDVARVVETPSEIRRLELDSGSLVLDVVPGEEEFALATPFGSVKSDGGRIAVSVGPDGTIVEVLDGTARIEPIEGSVAKTVPTEHGEVHLVYVELDPNPDLLARIAELEERLRELDGVVEDESTLTPEQAVEKHDWKALAESLAEVGEDLRAGRVPDDPDALVKYGRNLKKLRALARALGVPPTIEAIARDPRTGPSLIAANVARLWPDAPAADVAAAKRQAEDALIRHQTALSTASTPAATAAAEADLKSDLKDVIDEVERSNGPPTVKVEFEVPVEVIPEEPEVESELEPEPADPTNADPTNADEASSATPTTTADQVLGASGLATPTRRVYEGSRTDLTRRVHSAWKTDRGYDADATASLEAHAVRWIEDYAAELASTKSEVVAALNAGLGQGTAPGGVSKADVAALQGRLMDLQAAVERRLPAGSRTPDAPVPTFFLERSASVTLKSLR